MKVYDLTFSVQVGWMSVAQGLFLGCSQAVRWGLN